MISAILWMIQNISIILKKNKKNEKSLKKNPEASGSENMKKYKFLSFQKMNYPRF